MTKKCIGLAVCLCILAAFGCNGPGAGEQVLTADIPLHLEEHLGAARIEGSEIPKNIPSVIEWRFDQAQPDWKQARPFLPKVAPPQLDRVEDALRVTLTKEARTPWGSRQGSIYVDLPDWNKDDWGFVVLRARTMVESCWLDLCYNLRDKPGKAPNEQSRYLFYGAESSNLIGDGAVHTYLLPIDDLGPEGWKGPWKQMGISVSLGGIEKDDSRKDPVSVDILSISVIPKESSYAKSRAGTSSENWGTTFHRVLYAHVPGKLEFTVKIPDKGRLDLGLGVLKKTALVRFRVSARERASDTSAKTMLEETLSGEAPRVRRSVDLSGLAGKTMVLALETAADQAGNIAFWAAPTISGRRATEKPNVVFYVIDGATADFMSVYGSNRRTTPFLERLAAEGAVFENAYSNSTWTKVSVPAFMTSLHSSVLGGFRDESDPLPEQAVTMAERMHRAGYVTEVLTSNPYCGRMSSLDRGVDSIEDEEDVPAADLQKEFWRLREAWPGEPYWVHFQTTDVHGPRNPVMPFGGLFATSEESQTLADLYKNKKIWEAAGDTPPEKMINAGLDPAAYAQIDRKLKDEALAYQDYMIGRLVERLKLGGEWENTLFIVAADHGMGTYGLAAYDPARPKYMPPLLAAKTTKVPMIFVWPGKIAPGQRFVQPVSMIDILPTVLDLAGLPAPETAQGQSLAPLLLGKPGWEPRPVVFDEFNIEGNYFYGSIEVIDGRWGASLLIDPRPDDKKKILERLRPAPLLVFDIWEDPQAFFNLHAERPDLVEKYSKMLGKIWEEHKALAKKFSRVGNVPLTPGQIETLRSLGYLR
jgi:arylsulfatase A-like enzyme